MDLNKDSQCILIKKQNNTTSCSNTDSLLECLYDIEQDVLQEMKVKLNNTPQLYIDDIIESGLQTTLGTDMFPLKNIVQIIMEETSKLTEYLQMHVVVRIFEVWKMYIETRGLYYNSLLSILHNINERKLKRIISPGEPVGINGGQSFYEKFTQGALSSFHNSGMNANPVHGGRAILEMFNSSKTVANPVIYPIEGLNPKFVKHTSMMDIIEFSGIRIDEKYGEKFNSNVIELIFKPYYVEDLNILKLLEKHVRKIIGKTTKFFLHEDNKFGVDIVFRKKKVKRMIMENLIRIMHISAWGIPGVYDYNEEQKFVSLNLKKINPERLTFEDIYNCNPKINLTKIRSNSLYFIYKNLGIEAVKSYLLDELPRVIYEHGIKINPNHINTIISNMTREASIRPNTRHGIDLEDDSVFQKASFETALKCFSEAAFNKMEDSNNNPSGAIILGSKAVIGTMYKSIGILNVPDVVEKNTENMFKQEEEEYGTVKKRKLVENENKNYEEEEYMPASPSYTYNSPQNWVMEEEEEEEEEEELVLNPILQF